MKFILFFIAIILLLNACSHVSKKEEQSPQLSNRPAHHTENGFQNDPYVETAAPKGVMFYLRRAWTSIFTPDIPEGHVMSANEALAQLNAIKGDRLTWLGHATFLIQISGKNIITDPFLSGHASPVSWAGPKRYVDSGLTIADLPQIDIVVISHNHYDHLDETTIEQLNNKEDIDVFVPLGLKPFFVKRGFKRIYELDWHDSINIEGIEFTALPSIHDSARSVSDRNKTLWASWGIKTNAHNLLFIGDSAYSAELYQDIGNTYGPFDYSIVPIGAYAPRELLWMSHVTPEESIQIGKDTHSNTLIASHWGTISSLSDEPPYEPPVRFKNSGLTSGYNEQQIWVMKVGESRAIEKKTANNCNIELLTPNCEGN